MDENRLDKTSMGANSIWTNFFGQNSIGPSWPMTKMFLDAKYLAERYIGYNVIGHIYIGQKYFGQTSIRQNDFGRNDVFPY